MRSAAGLDSRTVPSVDHQHGFRHAAERALQHIDRQAQLVMGGDEMLGAFGNGRFELLVGCRGLQQRALQRNCSALVFTHHHGHQQQDYQRADHIDAEQHDAGPARIRLASGQKLLFAAGHPLQISRQRLHQAASLGAVTQRVEALVIAIARSRSDSAATSMRRRIRGSVASISVTWSGLSRSASFRSSSAGAIRPRAAWNSSMKPGYGRSHSRERALGAANQQPHVRDLLQHLDGVVDPGQRPTAT